jgi:hypothetical protein
LLTQQKPDEDFDEHKDRLEQNIGDFPENAARWTGEKVGEVEDIPENIEEGFDRFGNRIENGFDNVGDRIQDGWNDVVDAPENVANWVSSFPSSLSTRKNVGVPF